MFYPDDDEIVFAYIPLDNENDLVRDSTLTVFFQYINNIVDIVLLPTYFNIDILF